MYYIIRYISLKFAANDAIHKDLASEKIIKRNIEQR